MYAKLQELNFSLSNGAALVRRNRAGSLMVNIIMECRALITFNDYFIGVKYNKMSLAYVDAICRKRKEKADMVEFRNRDKKKLHESILRGRSRGRAGNV
jgi:hypothetical protein